MEQIALNNNLVIILVSILIWEGIWKLIGLWKSAKNNQIVWFILIGILNTIGIIPILYILFFQKKIRKK
jgi:hypothetical protein